MKKYTIFILFLLPILTYSQNNNIDAVINGRKVNLQTFETKDSFGGTASISGKTFLYFTMKIDLDKVFLKTQTQELGLSYVETFNNNRIYKEKTGWYKSIKYIADKTLTARCESLTELKGFLSTMSVFNN